MVNLEDVKRLVNGRDIAVVGNAQSILTRGAGPQIDEHDLVVRFNAGLPKSHAHLDRKRREVDVDKRKEIKPEMVVPHIGNRTSVMAGSYFSRELWKRSGEPMIWYCRTKRCDDKHIAWFQNECPEKIYVVTPSFNLLGLMERPSCGLITCCFLLERCKPKRIVLFGFDFFETPTWYWKFIAKSPHSGDRERSWFQNHGFVDRGDGSFEWVGAPQLERKTI